jgi:Replication-relaxation
MDCANVEWSRKNREAGRPFIEHQLEIVDFYIALQRGVRHRTDICIIDSDILIAAFPEQTRNSRNPLALRVNVSNNGNAQEIGLIPDMVFGLLFADGSRRCFTVEIDRGTMPVSRTDITQSSFERKMRAYLAAYAGRQHEERFGWKTFRVLTVTTDHHRMRSMMETLRQLNGAPSPGAALFLFAVRDELFAGNPIAHTWQDGNGREVTLM